MPAGKSLVISSDPAAPGFQSTRFHSLGGDPALRVTTETQGQTPVRFDGTFSRLGVNVNGTHTSNVYNLRKAAASVNLTVAPTDNVAGEFNDTTNTDAILSGDKLDILFNGTSTSTYMSRLVFLASANTVGLHQCSLTFSTNVAVTHYCPVDGRASTTTATVADPQLLIRAAGVLSNWYVLMGNNAHNASVPVTANINGVDATCTVTVPATTTGLFEDTTHTDNLASGDQLCASLNFTGSGAWNPGAAFGLLGCGITNTTGKSDLFAVDIATANPGAAASDRAPPIGGVFESGGSVIGATNAISLISPQFDLTWSNIRVYLKSNTWSVGTAIVTKIAGSTGTQSITVPASTTGWLEDTSHTDSVTANQSMQFSWNCSAHGTGNAVAPMIGSTITDPAGAGAAPTGSAIGGQTHIFRTYRPIGY